MSRPAGSYPVCGKHRESCNVVIERVELQEPRQDDLLAVPAAGASTLGMASNYNALLRPVAALVVDGEVRPCAAPKPSTTCSRWRCGPLVAGRRMACGIRRDWQHLFSWQVLCP